MDAPARAVPPARGMRLARPVPAGASRPCHLAVHAPKEQPMSLLKWTLAMAGAAVGLRYMSDRHRKRLSGAPEDGGERAAQTDRDTGRDTSRDTDRDASQQADRHAAAAWSAPQGGGLGGTGGMAGTSGPLTGTSTGSTAAGPFPGSTTGPGLGGSSVSQDDLLAPDSDKAPGSSSNRF